MSQRIVFAGTPEFAVPSLRALSEAGHVVCAVYTQPDRPSGRGRRLRPGPVKQLAVELGLPVEQPASLRNDDVQRQLAAYRPDLLVVVAYGLLLPPAVLELPTHGCLNVHASLLPRWRGAAPIQHALLAGDRHTGVSIMLMDAGLDTGPVLATRCTAIAAGENSAQLHDRLALLGAEALTACLPQWCAGALRANVQAHDGVTYAGKIERAHALIDWHQPAASIDRQVRAFNPWPVASTRRGEQTLRIWEATPLAGEAGPPGRVVATGAHGIDVATGDGLLRISRLQLPGKRAQAAADFLNAHSLDGVTFGPGSD